MSDSNDTRIKLYVFGYKHANLSISIDVLNVFEGTWTEAHRNACNKMMESVKFEELYPHAIVNPLEQIFVLEWIPASVIQRPWDGGKDDLEKEHSNVV